MRMFSDESDSDFKPKSKVEGSSETQLTEHITNLIDQNDVCVFMKGSKKMPQCGFSQFVVVLMRTYGVAFKDVNVLADNNLRQSIKDFSNWPTIPQVYIKGQFIGGCDIIKEMHEDGSLRELLINEKIIKE
jgi:monothiol glutaredoxin